MFYDDVLVVARREGDVKPTVWPGGYYEVSNVSEYFFAESREEYWPSSKFPCCVPPHRLTWIESKRPTHTVSEVHGTQRWTGPGRWGLLITRHDMQAYFAGTPEPWVWAKDDRAFEIPTTARWLLETIFFLEYEPPHVIPAGKSFTLLDEKGSIMRFMSRNPVADRGFPLKEGQDIPWVTETPARSHEWFYIPPSSLPATEEGVRLTNSLAHEARRLSEPIWLALSLLHCSNTVTEEGVHPRPERRRALREHRALCRFKVLKVEPVTHVVHPPAPLKEGEVRPPVEPGHVSLHIRRGHFRDYRDGKGLFGKIHKLVWYDQMRVGSSAAGEVQKTYEVRP